MKKVLLLIILLSFGSFQLSSCSKDEDATPPCRQTRITMYVNGEFQAYQALGRGIDLKANGYEMFVQATRLINNTARYETFTFILPYKKTGPNSIEKCLFTYEFPNSSFTADLLDYEFKSNVITNTRFCFYATFSAKFNNGIEDIVITDGEFSYLYEEPYDN